MIRAPSASGLPLMEGLAADREHALTLTPVSRETTQRLELFVELLLDWQARMNLIAASTIAKLWTRHVADSLQLLALAPRGKVWVDLGSGGGFPGLVVACALAEVPGASVHLVESNGKKATFLTEACRATGVPAQVHRRRAEDFTVGFRGPLDVVTARALAPLKTLLALASPLLARPGVIGLFPKGQNAETELGVAREYWNINVNLVSSRTEPTAQVLVVDRLEPVRTTA
ncbi:MAG: 16S rRNA (guanine(527)-N(7))-methyltransferase RsmG [Xanthobacteraceae bacterium]